MILLITNRKRRSLTPYSKKLWRAYTVNIASRADLGQWQFTSAKILLSTDHAWNKEGVAGTQKWLPYHLPEGYSGVTGVQRQRQNESNWTLGNSPRAKTLTPSASINITHTLELKMQLSLSLAQHFLFETLFVLQIKPISHAFLSFFSCCTTLDCSNISFSIYEFNYLHRNLTHIKGRIFFRTTNVTPIIRTHNVLTSHNQTHNNPLKPIKKRARLLWVHLPASNVWQFFWELCRMIFLRLMP